MRTGWARQVVLLAVAASIIPACGGGRGGGGGTAGTGGSNPTQFINWVTGGVGGFKISSQGGGATNGAGGNGNAVTILATCASSINILPTGTVNTSFAVPGTLPNLGPHPRTISSSVTVAHGAVRSLTVTQDGDLGLVADDLFYPATGLLVTAGNVITLSPNNVASPNATSLTLIFSNGVQLDGLINMSSQEASPGSAANLSLQCQDFVSRNGSNLSLMGNTAAVGANGGQLQVVALGTLVNAAAINTSGGAGTAGNGGVAGPVVLSSFGFGIYNSGTIFARGGDGTGGVGGAGNGVQIAAIGGASVLPSGGSVMNSGIIDTSGGDGDLGGGAGGGIALQAVMLTSGTLLLMVFLYANRIIRVTDQLKAGVIMATGALCVFYFASPTSAAVR